MNETGRRGVYCVRSLANTTERSSISWSGSVLERWVCSSLMDGMPVCRKGEKTCDLSTLEAVPIATTATTRENRNRFMRRIRLELHPETKA